MIIQKQDKKYPERLKYIKNPPEKLYIKGNENLLNQNSIAIVGSRTCSDYRQENGKKIRTRVKSYWCSSS